PASLVFQTSGSGLASTLRVPKAVYLGVIRYQAPPAAAPPRMRLRTAAAIQRRRSALSRAPKSGPADRAGGAPRWAAASPRWGTVSRPCPNAGGTRPATGFAPGRGFGGLLVGSGRPASCGNMAGSPYPRG